MTRAVLLIFFSIAAIAMGHYFVDARSWQHTQTFGGLLNPPTPGRNQLLPGELSFLTWVFHWAMIADYCFTLPRFMWRWGDEDLTANSKWKLYTILHLPAFAVNGVVMANHLHRDQLVVLKLLHPLLVFIGSIATLFGSYAVSEANGWSLAKSQESPKESILKPAPKDAQGKDWDITYSLASIAFGSLLAYGSLYLTV